MYLFGISILKNRVILIVIHLDLYVFVRHTHKDILQPNLGNTKQESDETLKSLDTMSDLQIKIQ